MAHTLTVTLTHTQTHTVWVRIWVRVLIRVWVRVWFRVRFGARARGIKFWGVKGRGVKSRTSSQSIILKIRHVFISTNVKSLCEDSKEVIRCVESNNNNNQF